MSRVERAFVIFYFAYYLAYFICLMFGPLLDSKNLAFVVLMPVCFIGMFLSVCLFVVVIRDLRKREFANPGFKVIWTVLFFIGPPIAIIVYLFRHGFHPRISLPERQGARPSDRGADVLRSPQPSGVGRRLLLDCWFSTAPVAVVAIYLLCFYILDGRLAVSPYAPPGHPWHISWDTWWLLNIATITYGILWVFTATLTSYMVIGRPSVKSKGGWYTAAFLLMPIAGPLCYFAKLRKANVPTAWPAPAAGRVSDNDKPG